METPLLFAAFILNRHNTLCYAMLNLSKGQRSFCAQLRSGTLPLAIETGRFIGAPEVDM